MRQQCRAIRAELLSSSAQALHDYHRRRILLDPILQPFLEPTLFYPFWMMSKPESESSPTLEDQLRGCVEGMSKGCVQGLSKGCVGDSALKGCVDVASFDFLRDGVSADNETRADIYRHLNTTSSSTHDNHHRPALLDVFHLSNRLLAIAQAQAQAQAQGSKGQGPTDAPKQGPGSQGTTRCRTSHTDTERAMALTFVEYLERRDALASWCSTAAAASSSTCSTPASTLTSSSTTATTTCSATCSSPTNEFEKLIKKKLGQLAEKLGMGLGTDKGSGVGVGTKNMSDEGSAEKGSGGVGVGVGVGEPLTMGEEARLLAMELRMALASDKERDDT